MMDENQLELLRRLFAETTARLEEAHEVAIEGQGAGLPIGQYADLARRLGRAAGDIATLADDIASIASGDDRGSG